MSASKSRCHVFPLKVSGEGLPWDVKYRLVESVIQPSLASLLIFFICRLLLCALPYFFIAESVWQANPKNSSEAFVYERSDFLHGGDSDSPGLVSLKEDRFYDGVEDPELDVDCQAFGSPDVLQKLECDPYLANSDS